MREESSGFSDNSGGAIKHRDQVRGGMSGDDYLPRNNPGQILSVLAEDGRAGELRTIDRDSLDYFVSGNNATLD